MRGEVRPIPCHRTSDCSFNALCCAREVSLKQLMKREMSTLKCNHSQGHKIVFAALWQSQNVIGKSIFQRTMKQFGSVATRTPKIDIKEHYFASAGISLHRRFYNGLRLMMCLRSTDMFASRKRVSVRLFTIKPCFSLKCVTLNSQYTEANPQGIGSFPTNQCH